VAGGRQAKLPKSEATESLARVIASMPGSVWPLHAATAIATRLIALLPTQSSESQRSPSTSADGAKAGRFLMIGLILVSFASVIAFQAGVFTPVPMSDGSGVASFGGVPPR